MTDEYGNNPIGSTTNFKLTHDEQKHEEIKLMAFKLYIANRPFVVDKDIPFQRILKTMWVEAEEFYKFAKEKEQEENNDKSSER